MKEVKSWYLDNLFRETLVGPNNFIISYGNHQYTAENNKLSCAKNFFELLELFGKTLIKFVMERKREKTDFEKCFNDYNGSIMKKLLSSTYLSSDFNCGRKA